MCITRYCVVLSCVAGFLLAENVRADHPTIAFGSESAGPIGTIATAPLPKGAWGGGLRTEYVNFDRFSDAELKNKATMGIEDVHSVDSLTNTSISIAHGITDDLTVSARLSHVKRKNIREGEIEDGDAEAHDHGDSSGIGDLLVLGQFRFLDGSELDASLLGGVKAPTGTTNNKDGGEKLETEFQPGTGSWDFVIGASASFNSGRTGLHGNVLYNLTTEGSQDTEIGNAFFYNFGVTYTLLSDNRHSDEGHSHSHLTWDAMLELNGETRKKNEIDNVNEDNSGGDLLFLSPGVRLSSSDGWSAFLSVGFPVHDDLNGVQTDVDYRVVGGVGVAF